MRLQQVEANFRYETGNSQMYCDPNEAVAAVRNLDQMKFKGDDCGANRTTHRGSRRMFES
jgi:hypothetical protein